MQNKIKIGKKSSEIIWVQTRASNEVITYTSQKRMQKNIELGKAVGGALS